MGNGIGIPLPSLAASVLVAPPTSARNTISAPTTTVVPLTLQTTDNNTTKPLLRFLASDGTTELASFGATGILTMTDAYISRSASGVISIDRRLHINGPGEGLGLGQVLFGANVDMQSNVANSGFTVGANSGTLVISFLRRDQFVGTGTIAYHQGEGINASGSSYIAGTFEFVQTSNVAGAETAQIRISTMNSGTRAERWRMAAAGNWLAAGATTTAVGSVSAPYISRIADPNTGIYWPANASDDIIAIVTGGVEALRADASQNVLIGGTTTAQSLLTVVKLDSTTGVVTTALTIGHNTNGTPTTNFGTGLAFQAHDTTTINTAIAAINAYWTTATHASRASRMDYTVTDNAATRTVISIGANGSAATFSLFNVTPAIQYATTGTATGFTAGAGTTVTHLSTFTGNTGSTAYTIGDVVRALKLSGLVAA